MAPRKRFLLRIDPRLYDALERWAADELRSVNAQIEFLLTDATRRAGRLKPPAPTDVSAGRRPAKGSGSGSGSKAGSGHGDDAGVGDQADEAVDDGGAEGAS